MCSCCCLHSSAPKFLHQHQCRELRREIMRTTFCINQPKVFHRLSTAAILTPSDRKSQVSDLTFIMIVSPTSKPRSYCFPYMYFSAELVTPYGYIFEEHFITTDDGYILRLHRYCHERFECVRSNEHLLSGIQAILDPTGSKRAREDPPSWMDGVQTIQQFGPSFVSKALKAINNSSISKPC
jgi:hypothetical protein